MTKRRWLWTAWLALAALTLYLATTSVGPEFVLAPVAWAGGVVTARIMNWRDKE